MANNAFHSQQAEDRNNQEKQAIFGLILALGVVIGVIAMIAIRPKKKPQTRSERIAEAIEHGIEVGERQVVQAVARLEKQFDELRKTVDEKVKR